MKYKVTLIIEENYGDPKHWDWDNLLDVGGHSSVEVVSTEELED